MGFDAVLAALFRVSSKNPMQRIERHPAEFRARQADSCQWRLSKLSQIDVVKSDDRQIVGDPKARVVNGAQCAEGSEIIRREYCGRPLLQLQQAVHGSGTTVDFVIPFHDESAISGKIVFIQAVKKGRPPRTCRLEVHGAADETDAAVTERGQMVHCFADAEAIIHADIADPGAPLAAIEKK